MAAPKKPKPELNIPVAEIFAPALAEELRYIGVKGGRGSGKSWFVAGEIVSEHLRHPGTRSICVREVQKALKESAKRLIEDRIEALGVGALFESKVDRIDAPGGGVISFAGMQDHTAESIKSLENYRVAWVEEAQVLSQRSLEMLRPTIRADKSKLYFTWNPRSADDPVDKFLAGPTPLPPNAICLHANYDSNPWFPSALKDEMAHDKIHNPDRFAHIWLGAYEPMALGALWRRQLFTDYRRGTEGLTKLGRIVVAIDPAVSAEADSDEHGIIVAGLGEDRRGYVLEDGSLRGAPRQWAERAVTLMDKWQADCIVVERNQGGDMVADTVRTVRPSCPIIEVTATRGKHVRAEPIAALYASGRVSHVGTFPELENQLCLITASGYEGRGSPDRADALVWAMTQLFPALITQRIERVKQRQQYDYGMGWMG